MVVIALAPRLLEESRADPAHRHFDLPGAASITGGLMLLVYAMTQAVQHGWGATETIVVLAVSGALIVAFIAIELRSAAPLLPMRIFRLRTLTEIGPARRNACTTDEPSGLRAARTINGASARAWGRSGSTSR